MQHIKRYAGFYSLYILFLIVLGLLLLMHSKVDLHLLLTSYHTDFTDFLFKHLTEIGGSIPVIIAILLILYKYRAAIFAVSAQIVVAITTNILKKIFSEPRPKLWFRDNFPDVELHRVEGVHLHSVNSFPSGHTASAFAIFLALAFMTKNKALQMVYAVLAISAGYSRIYLSQHFAADVFLGSIVGVFATVLCWFCIENRIPKWGNYSLLKVDKRKTKKPNKSKKS